MEERLPPGQFYGKTLLRREAAGLTLTESVYRPGLGIARHSHERAYICVVLQGAYTEVSESRIRLCRPSTVILHPPEEPHADRFHDAGGRTLSIELEPYWLARVRNYSPILESPAEFEGGRLAWLAVRLYGEVRVQDSVAPLAIEGLLLEMLAEATRRSSDRRTGTDTRPPGWLIQVRDLLDTRFTESLSLEEIAGAAAIHPVHLARVFRTQYGCTVGEYIRQLRIEHAGREVAASDTPLAEIALAYGFADQSHFSRTFKRLVGMTPAQFRLAMRAR